MHCDNKNNNANIRNKIMTGVIVQRIDWRETLLGIKKGRSFEKVGASAKEINAAKQMAVRLKKEGKGIFYISLTDDSVSLRE